MKRFKKFKKHITKGAAFVGFKLTKLKRVFTRNFDETTPLVSTASDEEDNPASEFITIRGENPTLDVNPAVQDWSRVNPAFNPNSPEARPPSHAPSPASSRASSLNGSVRRPSTIISASGLWPPREDNRLYQSTTPAPIIATESHILNAWQLNPLDHQAPSVAAPNYSNVPSNPEPPTSFPAVGTSFDDNEDVQQQPPDVQSFNHELSDANTGVSTSTGVSLPSFNPPHPGFPAFFQMACGLRWPLQATRQMNSELSTEKRAEKRACSEQVPSPPLKRRRKTKRRSRLTTNTITISRFIKRKKTSKQGFAGTRNSFLFTIPL